MALLKGLFTGEYAYAGPFHVTVDLTRTCNLSCLGCRYQCPDVNFPSSAEDHTVRNLSVDLFKTLCADLKQMGTTDVIFTGEGEPLLHPRFLDLVREAKASGFYLTLITNGTLLNSEIIQALIDARLDAIKVSLWASSIDQYTRNYPGTNPDYFIKVVDRLRLLTSIKRERESEFPVVYIHHVVNRHNFQTVERMVDLARETGCDRLSFAPFKAWKGDLKSASLSADAQKALEYTLATTGKETNTVPLKLNVEDALLRYRIGERVWEKLPCYIAWFHARVKIDGTVLPCDPCDSEAGKMGSLIEEGFPEIWNGPAYRAFRRKVLTREGLSAMHGRCDCGFCCHLVHNAQIHRIFRYVAPVARHFWNTSGNE
jgi:MoaA/NifB/PqqE/SkfB family radical SAM enzyme